MKIIFVSVFLFLSIYSVNSYYRINTIKKQMDNCSYKIDSLIQVKTCYCKKLEFLDTLSDKEINIAFKKSRCKIL
jgi:hypothetical protein